jgi:hypothetical protein
MPLGQMKVILHWLAPAAGRHAGNLPFSLGMALLVVAPGVQWRQPAFFGEVTLRTGS